MPLNSSLSFLYCRLKWGWTFHHGSHIPPMPSSRSGGHKDCHRSFWGGASPSSTSFPFSLPGGRNFGIICCVPFSSSSSSRRCQRTSCPRSFLSCSSSAGSPVRILMGSLWPPGGGSDSSPRTSQCQKNREFPLNYICNCSWWFCLYPHGTHWYPSICPLSLSWSLSANPLAGTQCGSSRVLPAPRDSLRSWKSERTCESSTCAGSSNRSSSEHRSTCELVILDSQQMEGQINVTNGSFMQIHLDEVKKNLGHI